MSTPVPLDFLTESQEIYEKEIKRDKEIKNVSKENIRKCTNNKYKSRDLRITWLKGGVKE